MKKWRAVMPKRVWINDYILGIQKGQTGMAAFYVEGTPGKQIEVAFRCQGDGQLWINGIPYEQTGTSGIVGRKLTLPQRFNLFMIRLSNTGGNAGFTCKLLEPAVGLKPGQQAKKTAKGIAIYLATPELMAEAEKIKKERIEAEKNAESIIAPSSTEDNIRAAFNGKLEVSDEAASGKKAILLNKTAHVSSKQIFKIDQDKKYKLSYSIKNKGTKPSRFYLGFQALDANKKPIYSSQVHFYPNTETELIKDYKAGDKELFIKDGSKWKKSSIACVAFNVDDSGNYKDIPNRNLTNHGITSIVKINGGWKIALTTPCRKSFLAGTKVREHKNWTYATFLDGGNAPQAWTQRTFVVDKMSSCAPEKGSWWPGTKYVRIYIVAIVPENTDSGLLIDDLKLFAY
jgi:hypothetical protein